ncbi:MAG: amino acid adenylation domain-containing protein [Candidatus Rokuibacteriota bacterium]|nr:MAG: amino acid adenylation domain-containing protein [Candidatus Rokubacteria bacterium]
MSRLLQHALTAQADRRPEAVALVMDGARMTYAHLEAASNRLARMLRASGVQRGDRVALLLPKSPRAIVAIVAVLKADAIYVPLDTTSPLPRLARMLQSTAPRCLLAEAGVAAVAADLLAATPERAPLALGWIDGPPPPGPWASRSAGFSATDVEALADTVLDTGVVISHANVQHFVDWATTYFALGPDDRTSGHSPLHFDLSTFDIFGTLGAGGQLHLVPPGLAVAPDAVPRFIRDAALTQWFSVPSLLTYVVKFDAVRPNDFPSLRRLLWCGEVLPTPVLRTLMARLPHVSFTNLYGPTEATVASSYHTVPACPATDDTPIPIGAPCAGEQLRVLDAERRPVPAGEIGELYIAGVGLSAGYWREPEKTAAVFVTDAAGVRLYRTGDLGRRGTDGLFYFVGRVDSQVKSRGYRIELGEIEAALHHIPEVREAAVVAVDTGGFEGAAICCAYAPAPGAPLTPVTLRQALAAVLPAYMLPARWRRLDTLPKNANGKIDRPALRAAFAATA